MTPAPHTAPMTQEAMIALANQLDALCHPNAEVLSDYDRINQFIKLGNQAVSALRAAASPRLAGSREPVRWLVTWPDGATSVVSDLPEDGRASDVVYTPLYTHPAHSESVGWRDIESRPEIDKQPGRQFILLEGSCSHSGASWLRQYAGMAYIRRPGTDGEMLQYRKDDILRLCTEGDMDPRTARVTHWMPAKFPAYPHSKKTGGAG